MKIKVCGMTDAAQVQALVDMGVDYAGFIFYAPSPRYVVGKLDAATVQSITCIKKVGVFVKEELDVVQQMVINYGLDFLQLHGDEAPAYCEAARKLAPVIKVFRVDGTEDLENLTAPFVPVADYFLFDTLAKDYGGTGKKFDWDFLSNARLKKPYFLSGGIGPGDAKAIRLLHQQNQFFAVDVNSRFETTPGIKDMDRVSQFLAQIKQ